MKGPLLILVKTLTTKFGAYSDKGLDEVGGWRKSSNSYLFGINKKNGAFELDFGELRRLLM